jgi:hypothetical protein
MKHIERVATSECKHMDIYFFIFYHKLCEIIWTLASAWLAQALKGEVTLIGAIEQCLVFHVSLSQKNNCGKFLMLHDNV